MMVYISKKPKPLTPKLFLEIYRLQRERKRQFRKEKGDWVNTWYLHEACTITPKKPLPDLPVLYCDEYWTLAKCDEYTAGCLYRIEYNPLTLRIEAHFGAQYCLRIHLNSLDDFCYAIESHPTTNRAELEIMRTQIMGYVSENRHGVNGENLLDFAVSIGFDENTKHY